MAFEPSVGSPIPAQPQTFSQEKDRVRLTPVALEAIKNTAVEHWKLRGQDAAALLGVSPSTWDRMVAGKRGTLSQDALTRVSALVGLFKGLHLLFADDMADRWVHLRNRGPVFNNRTPLETMIEGGIPAMLEVRHHVDALRGGL